MQWLVSKTKGDLVIWMVVFILSIFSLLAVYSSTGTLAYKYHAGNTEYYLLKQVFLLIFGLGLMYFAHLVNYKYYSRLAQMFLWISIPLLILTYLWGLEINDAKRWLTLPVINITFQTSDLGKLALIMYTARMLSRKQEFITDFWKAYVPIMGAIVLICALIAPADFSSAATLFVTCMLLMFIGRISFKHIGLTIVAGIVLFIVGIGLASATGNMGRIDTWKSRIENYITDDKGSYQNQQAKIAIATGGIMGKGPGNSTQRNFLPNPFSDFIYAIIIEEYGMIGGILMIVLYLVLLFRSILIVQRSPRAFGALLAVGLSFSLVIQAFINMGVAVHLFPVTGLTLPLVSMGGTSLWFTSLAFGIILSVSRDIEENEKNEDIIETEDRRPKQEVAPSW
jgi:cell division protein FtsW